MALCAACVKLSMTRETDTYLLVIKNEFKNKCKQEPIKKKFDSLRYADDLAIVANAEFASVHSGKWCKQENL